MIGLPTRLDSFNPTAVSFSIFSKNAFPIFSHTQTHRHTDTQTFPKTIRPKFKSQACVYVFVCLFICLFPIVFFICLRYCLFAYLCICFYVSLFVKK